MAVKFYAWRYARVLKIQDLFNEMLEHPEFWDGYNLKELTKYDIGKDPDLTWDLLDMYDYFLKYIHSVFDYAGSFNMDEIYKAREIGFEVELSMVGDNNVGRLTYKDHSVIF